MAQRLSFGTVAILHAIASGSEFGFDIMDATGLPSGTVYPILRRLDAEGCVRSRWEKEGVARKEQRPPRRYYELTAGGKTIALDAKARTQAMAEAGKRLLRPAESES